METTNILVQLNEVNKQIEEQETLLDAQDASVLDGFPSGPLEKRTGLTTLLSEKVRLELEVEENNTHASSD